MSETSTLGIVLGFIAVCITQAVAWNAGRVRANRTDTKIDQASASADTAATEAATAAKRSEPTSNGFADTVRDGMAEMLRGQRDLITGQATLAEELHEVRQKLDRHIGDHASADVRRGGNAQ